MFVWVQVEHGGEEQGDRLCFFYWDKVLGVQDAVESPIVEFVDMPQCTYWIIHCGNGRSYSVYLYG